MEKTRKGFDSEKVLRFIMDNKAVFILVIFIIIVNFITSNFFTSRNLTNILRQICTSCTLAVGFTLVLASGVIDLSVGCMLGMIGIATAMMSVAGLSAPVVIVSAIVLGMACGVLNALVISLFDLPPFIVTLATGMVYQGINLIICQAKSVTGLPEWYLFFGTGQIAGIPFPVIVMVVLVVMMAIVVARTRFGRYALACGGNNRAAFVSGINTKAILYGVYLVTGACVGIAALLLTGRTASAQTTAGVGMELDAVAAVVIGGTPMQGGKANVVGTLFGCLLIQVISNSLNLIGVDSNWQKIAKGLVIIIAIILDRQGARFLDKLRVRKAA